MSSEKSSSLESSLEYSTSESYTDTEQQNLDLQNRQTQLVSDQAMAGL